MEHYTLVKNSKRWALKFYCKADKIQTTRGRLSENLSAIGIENCAENKLRIELRLLSKQQKALVIVKVKELLIDKVRNIFDECLRKVEMSEQMSTKKSNVIQLIRVLKAKPA